MQFAQTDNRFEDDIHYIGGCVATDTVEWAATLPAILASPPDPKNLGERWREVWMERLERLTFPVENWLKHQKFDDYWQHGSISQLDRKFDCPALLIGGWSDRYSNTVLNCLDRDPENSWAIIGPWGHHYPDQASPGPGISFQKVAIRWWDHWLNNADNGVEEDPKLTVWVNEYDEPRNKIERRSGFWTSMQEWPIERKLEKLYLADATLQLEPTQSNLAKVIPVDLSVGCASGDTGYFGRTGGQPLNQREDDDRSLVFESPHIKDPFNLMGSVKVVLSVASDQKSSQISVRLCDVAEDGTVALVAFAIRNLSLTDDLKESRNFSPKQGRPNRNQIAQQSLSIQSRSSPASIDFWIILAGRVAITEICQLGAGHCSQSFGNSHLSSKKNEQYTSSRCCRLWKREPCLNRKP